MELKLVFVGIMFALLASGKVFSYLLHVYQGSNFGSCDGCTVYSSSRGIPAQLFKSKSLFINKNYFCDIVGFYVTNKNSRCASQRVELFQVKTTTIKRNKIRNNKKTPKTTHT